MGRDVRRTQPLLRRSRLGRFRGRAGRSEPCPRRERVRNTLAPPLCVRSRAPKPAPRALGRDLRLGGTLCPVRLANLRVVAARCGLHHLDSAEHPQALPATLLVVRAASALTRRRLDLLRRVRLRGSGRQGGLRGSAEPPRPARRGSRALPRRSRRAPASSRGARLDRRRRSRHRLRRALRARKGSRSPDARTRWPEDSLAGSVPRGWRARTRAPALDEQQARPSSHRERAARQGAPT